MCFSCCAGLLSLSGVLFLYSPCFKVYFDIIETLFSCSFHLWSLFPSFTLNLCVFVALKWDSYRQHIVDSCFLFQFYTLCHLIEAFSPLAFKVIIDAYVFQAMYLLPFKTVIIDCISSFPFSFYFFCIILMCSSFGILLICCMFLICVSWLLQIC